MSRLLSPEQSKCDLDGSLELEELAEKLEEDNHEEVDSFDLIYSKDGRKSSQMPGSFYTLEEAASDWYDDSEIDGVEIDSFELDIQQVKMNAVTGETVLVDSSGNETRYDIASTYEGTTTFTQELGNNKYVFRYDSEEDAVRATEIGGDMEPSEWGNEELKKRTQLMAELYRESRNTLWNSQKGEETVETRNSKFEKLRPYYNAVKKKIEQNDKAVIREDTHVGSASGAHIKNNFKEAVRRVPDESMDDYEIENDGNEYPIVIEEA
ncbi:MAG: hypothetical protein ABEK04_02340 [Candidatus Nanohalobium sp.]